MSRARRALLFFGRTLALLATGSAVSFALDASRTHSFVLGPNPGFANGEWLDAQNTSRARVRFPRTTEVAFRARLPGGIGQAPACDAEGNLIVVHTEPRVSKLDPLGRSVWTSRLPTEAVSAPVLLSDGSILILTRDAEASLFWPSGKLRHRSALQLGELRHRTLLIATAAGGALIASGTDLVELDAAGEVVRQAHTQANTTAILQSGSALIAVAENGAVTRAHATGDFEPLGSLGGAAPEGGALQDGKLLAVVDAHKLVAFNLITGSVVTLASDPAVELNGPPALLENRGSALVADRAFLSLRVASGVETLRLAVSEAQRAFAPAARALRPAVLITDQGGSIAATRSGSDALIVQPDGKVTHLEDTSCLDPFRPTPTRFGVVFACRSGQLFGVSDRAP